MVYITVRQSPQYHQMTLEEFLFSPEAASQVVNPNISNTKTYEVSEVSPRFMKTANTNSMLNKLKQFNQQTDFLREYPRRKLYNHFTIPKKNGDPRPIDAPVPSLKMALYNLKILFEQDFGLLYHTSAFAYVKSRSHLKCMQRHQEAESRWYAKYDLSNFFGSTTLDFVMRMCERVFPLSELCKLPDGRGELEKALELAFLDGGLPQGTPFSPTITNIMMIPVDYKLSQTLRDFENQRYVYTRYADDFQVSSKYSFSFRKIEGIINGVLKEFNAPFKIKREKTRYGSIAGSNFNLGLMTNKDNQITVGHEKKRIFKAMLTRYIMDKKNGVGWDVMEVQKLDGFRNYYRMIEADTIDKMVNHINKKFHVNVVKMMKQDLRA